MPEYLKRVPILTLDANVDFVNDMDARTALLEQAKMFLRGVADGSITAAADSDNGEDDDSREDGDDE